MGNRVLGGGKDVSAMGKRANNQTTPAKNSCVGWWVTGPDCGWTPWLGWANMHAYSKYSDCKLSFLFVGGAYIRTALVTERGTNCVVDSPQLTRHTAPRVVTASQPRHVTRHYVYAQTVAALYKILVSILSKSLHQIQKEKTQTSTVHLQLPKLSIPIPRPSLHPKSFGRKKKKDSLLLRHPLHPPCFLYKNVSRNKYSIQ